MLIKKLYKTLLLPYTLLILYLMFLGFGRKPMDFHIVRVIPIVSTGLFVKEQFLNHNYPSIAINLIGNIVMFIPFGFLGWWSSRYNQLHRLVLDFLTAIFIIEACQYFTRLGIFDVDDILLNFLGVLIGFKIKEKF